MSVVVAGVGSRALSAGEHTLLRQTAVWLAQRGVLVRSGGARGSDTAWAQGVASVDPSLLTICLASDKPSDLRKVPHGAHVITPPYHPNLIDLAVAEWVFRDDLATVGLPPYRDEAVSARFSQARGWHTLKPYVRALFIRNVSVLHARPGEPVSAVLGLIGSKPGGGGTAHAFRLARALGIPAFNLRDEQDRERAREMLRPLAPLKPGSVPHR